MKSLPKTKITRNTGPHAPKNELKIKKLLTLLGKGKSLERACYHAGLTPSTVLNWKRVHSKFEDDFASAFKAGRRYREVQDHRDEGAQMLQLLDDLENGLYMREAMERAKLSPSDLRRFKAESDYFATRLVTAKEKGQAFRPKVEAPSFYSLIDLGFTDKRHLYFIRAEGSSLVKIGVTGDLLKRIKGMQGGCPIPLRVELCVKHAACYESLIHRHLNQLGLHSHGEWFQSEAQAIAMELIEKIAQSEVSSFEELVG
jgi:hypothetical protein